MYKEAQSTKNPFYRSRVKLKREIVTMGIPDINEQANPGNYIEPKDWDEFTANNVLVIDTRNHYETDTGKFKGAIIPDIDTFRQLPKWIDNNLDADKDQKIAMYCTGGIRCEKATALLKTKGYKNVYHLKGGILKYIEDINTLENTWEGQCFVFDNRVTVDNKLKQGQFDQCHGCRHPITEDDKLSKHYIRGVCCKYCFDTKTESSKNRARERQKQIDLAKARGEESPIGKTCKIS